MESDLIRFIDDIDENGIIKLYKKQIKIREKILRVLENFTITTTHLKTNVDLTISQFTLRGADRIFFKPGLTVEQYFKDEHNIQLSFPDIPCLKSTQPTVADWPLEVLKVTKKN